MLGEFTATNTVDENGNPTGGSVRGVGLSIDWQDGPLGRGADRKEPNGAFVETVIAGASQRIQFYQDANGGKFRNEKNEEAIFHLTTSINSALTGNRPRCTVVDAKRLRRTKLWGRQCNGYNDIALYILGNNNLRRFALVRLLQGAVFCISHLRPFWANAQGATASNSPRQ